jgi:demethylmenaquinone methyltransferase/2-methoxy-6-polyprenyl-1,4-benzoquinol methylase
MPGFDHFGLLAPWYDRIISYNDQAELIKWADLPIPGYLLDVGGGTGRVASGLIDHVDKIEIVDISHGMLKISKKKGLSGTCALGERLPYPDETFARILIIDALHHCLEQQAVLNDAWRVLAPDGLLIIVEPDYDHLAGKLIRMFEKLIMMNSHFLRDNEIYSMLFELSKNVEINHTKGNSWFKVRKF